MQHRIVNQRGFTLLEILVAFTILAVLGTALLQLFQGGMRSLAASEEYTRAALLAQSELSRLNSEPALQPAIQEGELEPGYRYRLSLEPLVEDGQTLAGLLQADLVVLWGDGGKNREYAVRTLLPTLTDGMR